MTKTRFRVLLVLSLVVGLAGAVAAFVGESRLPPPLREYLEERATAEPTPLEWVMVAVFLPLSVAYVASFVGLLRFVAWSRPMAAWACVAALAGLPLFGPTVEHGVATALFLSSNVLFGASLGIAYSHPDWFQPRRSRT
jgi:hypothetical protein